MTLYLSIDDTDEIGTKGTGELAEELAGKIHQLGLGHCSPVTRHQLFVHDDIPYTSHNSAMCFCIDEPGDPDRIRQLAVDHLLSESAPGSDPGLCLFSDTDTEARRALIEFGLKAKKEVLTKDQAYELAQRCQARLSEHGGSGDGVIGALAGIGLRLCGDDGRYKGQLALPEDLGQPVSIAALLRHTPLEQVWTLSHQPVPNHTRVELEGKLKAVQLNHRMTLLVAFDGDRWFNAQKRHLKHY
ncbi:hypothetical protein SAMN04488540_101200 [Ferrimonas sediminum]|uniref:tRNA(Ile2) 2-agmatinylcytidine synthetase n=1 Tax=Ferrimonas sediminum TaxID=718193 RepID=A0A1G8JYZ1_9GAMM|nr:hypothetical protein [Ferrimonas sediminum]SDI36404.1 hypothetical protein SAMN04488540_101200 [Ferrimonas sediminum]